MVTSLSRAAPGTATRVAIAPLATSMPTTSLRSATHSVPFDRAMPFGAFSPLTHSAAMTLPSRPSLPIEPAPSLPHGSPSMFET